ncbi:MAG: glycosyltransferase [Clostridium sp.]|nr:glycosyltransferase [Clostridium sp.]
MNMISIIILSCNNFKYYKKCFDSVFSQDYRSIQIIVSDDCSKDFDREIILNYINENKNENIKSVIINTNEKNIGIVKNYNKAISLSSGKYIFYLAIDDVFHDNDVLSDVVNFFEKTNYLIFTGYKDVYDETLTNYIKTLPRPIEVELLKSDDPKILYENLCKGSFISGSNTPFSRELIDKYGYLDEKYFYLEDYPRYLKLTRLGCKIGFYDRKLIKYRMGGVTTTGKINDYLRKDLFLTAYSECKEYFTKVWNNEWTKRKKIVAWGTGDCFESSLKLIDFKTDYLVDSNVKLQNTKINGFNVLSPQVLKNEDKDNIFIFVFSYANYFDIAKNLKDFGYEEEKNYFICTPNILKILKTK